MRATKSARCSAESKSISGRNTAPSGGSGEACRRSSASVNSAHDCPTHLRKLSCVWRTLTSSPCSEVRSTRIACVSPTNRSVTLTRGCENFARPVENALFRQSVRGNVFTMAVMITFQRSGAVPIATRDSPEMPRWRPTVSPSGNGQAHVLTRPMPSPKSTGIVWSPATSSRRSVPSLSVQTGSPNPRFVISRFTSPDPPSPAVK
mmetsp:Transcript_6221/g.15109  ORF Transcript_6221/g.15109 Transcript_6221/m.15109 type:complete len:205 (-) Transcript_6221:875-1489(-)